MEQWSWQIVSYAQRVRLVGSRRHSARSGGTVEVADYLCALRVRWRWIVSAVLLGVIGGVLAILVTKPVYAASAELFVATRQETGGADLYAGSSFAQQRVQSYAAIVNRPRVLNPVIQQFGLHMTADQLAAKVTVDAPVDTVLLDITVRDGNAAQAAAIANAVGKSFITVVDQLESADGPSPVRISSVRDAVVPATPATPNWPIDLAFGSVLGLIVGVAAAVTRQLSDKRVRTEEQLTTVVPTTVLGEIPYDRDAGNHPMLYPDPQGPRAEAFRALRTNLRFVEAAGRVKSFVITSSVSSEGKTTTVINIASLMAASGLKVVVVDGDMRRPHVAKYLGLVNTVGLSTVLVGAIDLRDALQPWGDGLLYALTAGDVPPNPSELLGATVMTDVVAELEREFDLIIFDTPPLLSVTDAAVLSAKTDGAIMLAGAGRVRRDELSRAVKSLEAAGVRMVGAVLNMVPSTGRSAGSYYRGTYGSVVEQPPTRWRRRAAKSLTPGADSNAAEEGVSIS